MPSIHERPTQREYGPPRDRMSDESFADHVLMDWHASMDTFFNAVDRKRRARDLTGKQVHEALSLGYGAETAGEWDEWYGDGDSDDD